MSPSPSSEKTHRKLIGFGAILVFFLGLGLIQAFGGASGEAVGDLALYGFLSFSAFCGANYGEHREKAKELAAWALPSLPAPTPKESVPK